MAMVDRRRYPGRLGSSRMSSPHRPRAKDQLNDPTSTLDGLNCTPTAGAIAADRHTLGKVNIRGGQVRAMTGDTSGGTNLPQVATALLRGWGVALTVRTGISIAAFDDHLHDGHGAILQGASSATRGTKYQASETFGGNHAWYVNEGRGWRLISGVWVPTEYLVYDPLADGRRAGIAKSPFWLPRTYLLTFARRLIVSGSTMLGPGRAYAAFTRDTEPHFHAAYGGKATSPFPDRTRGIAPKGRRVNVRSRPTTDAPIVEYLAGGELFTAYQRTDTGQSLSGSRRWYGDHDGKRWIHEAGLSHKGGST
jgi:hypothetical protein